MKDTDYAFCVAKIRANEKRLLSQQDIDTLVMQNSLTSAVNYLKEKGWACLSDDCDKIISDETDSLWKLLYQCVPDKSKLNWLLIFNDYFNLKAIVKCRLENISPEKLLLYPTNIDVKALQNSENFKNDAYINLCEKAYNEALKGKSGMLSDVIIDKLAINAFSYSAKNEKDKIYSEVLSFLADSANIKASYRCALRNRDYDFTNEIIGDCVYLNRDSLIKSAADGKTSLISYIKTTKYNAAADILIENPINFDKWQQQELINICYGSIYTSFGFSPVLNYYYKKINEIKKVKIILQGKEMHLAYDCIKERIKSLN